MDSETLIQFWQLFRVVAHAVTATYLTYLMFVRPRDKWLYASLAVQFAFVVVWSGVGVFNAEMEAVLRPWHTWPVLLTLIVIVRDFVGARSAKTKKLRKLEEQLSIEVQTDYA